MNKLYVNLSEIKSFVVDKFPDIYAGFLTGSAVDGFFNKESDYDVFIITYTRDFAFNESFIHSGKKIQIVHIPLNKVEEILWLDYFSKSGTHLGAFAKGVILVDKNQYLFNLINHCKTVFALGPTEASQQELFALKINIRNLISDLIGNNYAEEKLIISHDLYREFIKFYLTFHRNWCSSGKHLSRAFKIANNLLSNAVNAELQIFHQTLDPQKFVRLINEETELLGDFDNGYSIYTGLINVKTTYLVIFFANVTDYYKSRLELFASFHLLIEHKPKIFAFRSRPLGDNEEINEGLYLIIDSESIEYVNNIVLPSIKNLIEPLHLSRIKAHYPVNFDFSILFGGVNLLKPTFELFDYFSNVYCKNLSNYQDSIVFAIKFAIIFRNEAFENDAEWLSFLEFVNLSWLTRAYDNKKIHSISDIINAKNNLLNVFSDAYILQEESLGYIYHNLDDTIENQGLAIRLGLLCTRIRKNKSVNNYSCHPANFEDQNLIDSNWVVYKNIFDYIFSILLVPENQRSYLAFILKELSKVG